MTGEQSWRRSPWVAGVDGCPGGWIVALRRIDDAGAQALRLCRRFAEVLALDEKPRIVAVDIPIGLPERAIRGGRTCDNEARARLGERQSSVFAVPARAALAARNFAGACAINLRHSDPPRKVSRQCFNLFPKIREVDAALTPGLQARVFECHPELAFRAINGAAPVPLPKKIRSRPDPDGLRLRKALLLARGFDERLFDQRGWPQSVVGPDDVIDACAACSTALRAARGDAVCFPDPPPVDGRGLQMAIWA